ncbi:MAG: FAD:protein FMN transferase, partial [Acidobacteriota bacterium]|nr:FAD:protein FMN transferase [Acidobacteriota bacterium]
MIRVRTIAPLTFALLLSGTALAQATGFQREVLAMGTRLTLRIEGPSQEHSAVASEAAFGECDRIESATSTWKSDSVFSRLNQAGGQTFPLDREWLELLRRAKAWSRRTGGAFDPVLARLLAAYGVREGGRKPS